MRKYIWIMPLTLVLGFSLTGFAQEAGAPGKTPKSTVLIFREDFKVGKGEIQLGQDAITNPNVELKVYGPGSKPGNSNQSGLLLSAEEDTVHPGKMESYIFTGVVEATWGIMLKDKNNYMDLRDTARFIWRTRA